MKADLMGLLVWASARPDGHIRRPVDSETSSTGAVTQGFRHNSAWLLGQRPWIELTTDPTGLQTFVTATR